MPRTMTQTTRPPAAAARTVTRSHRARAERPPRPSAPRLARCRSPARRLARCVVLSRDPGSRRGATRSGATPRSRSSQVAYGKPPGRDQRLAAPTEEREYRSRSPRDRPPRTRGRERCFSTPACRSCATWGWQVRPREASTRSRVCRGRYERCRSRLAITRRGGRGVESSCLGDVAPVRGSYQVPARILVGKQVAGRKYRRPFCQTQRELVQYGGYTSTQTPRALPIVWRTTCATGVQTWTARDFGTYREQIARRKARPRRRRRYRPSRNRWRTGSCHERPPVPVTCFRRGMVSASISQPRAPA